MDTDKYKKLFLTEADEKIAALNKALLELEKNPASVNAANNAMRASHTLKSSAAAMNFMGISHLAHAMEDLFSAQGGQRRIEPKAVNSLFEAVDAISSAVKAIKNGKPEPDMKMALERLRKSNSQLITSNSDNEKEKKLPATDYGLQVTKIEPIEAIKVDVAVLDRLMNLTEELLVERMRLNELVSSIKYKVSSIQNFPKENFGLIHNTKYLIQKNNVTQEDIVKIDDLSASNENIGRLLSDLQFNVVQARMVPLGQIFERFPRMVRDLAKEQKKEIDFRIDGQEIELDRTIIDRLGEPLIHLLRNAVDHGIPASSAGKQKSGTITLSAERERDKVLVKVENDGNSINWQKVVEAALNRGLIDKITRDKYIKDIDHWKSSIEKLFYLGQLSTNEKVTEVSGRGVGLSIVKSAIESFGGRVFIESPIKSRQDAEINPKGEQAPYGAGAEERVGGTRFTLELPLTLAIIQALLVRVANQTFALPFSQIDRSVRVSITNIKKAFDQEVAVVEEEDIPMVRLAHLFDVGKRENLFFTEEELRETKHQLQAELMVITKRNEKQVGIVIDELISEQDIVVKPLKGVLKKTKGFAGVTLLGDGRPALILDIATLI